MTASPRSLLFVLGSARAGGNTEILARAAAAELPSGDRQRWIRLYEMDLPRFRDLRHAGRPVPPAEGVERELQDATLEATDIVIASPLYWYTLSATAKTYLDYWSNWERIPGLDFFRRMAPKRLWGIAALGDDDLSVAEPLAGTLRLSARYLGMEWRGLLLGNGSKPGQVESDLAAMRAAKCFLDLDQTWDDTPEVRF